MPLIDERWSDIFRDFVAQCLKKDASKRATAADLLQHPWLEGADNSAPFKQFLNK